jgi:putative membrane protein
MFDAIVRLLLYSVAVLITAYILPGVQVESFLVAVLAAAVLALLNAFVKPALILITIPVTFFTLGLFLLVINALVILLASAIVPGFEVEGFIWALLFSIILSFFSILFGANSHSSDVF